MSPRPYTMRTRALAAEETGRRIVDAAYALFSDHPYDDVTLAAIARAAAVSEQTVLRRFGSKEGLLVAVADQVRSAVLAQRDQAPADDTGEALANLVAHYEEMGDVVLRLLAQEERVPAIRRVTDRGRELHHAWVDRVFARELAPLGSAARRRRRAQLIAACDVYVWKVLRRDLGLSRGEVVRALHGLVEGAEG